MADVLVIGVGNPLRGDDGLGWHAIRELRATLPGGIAELIACHQLTPELAEPVARARRVIFIDAALGEEPGAVNVQPVDPGSLAPVTFSHQLDPPALMQYAKQLYESQPEAWTISVNSKACGYSETLSDVVRSSWGTVLNLLRDLTLSGGGCGVRSYDVDRRARGLPHVLSHTR